MNKHIELLKLYDKAYTEGRPAITDTEYDEFRRFVYSQYPDDPYFQTVGAPVQGGTKVSLPYVLGSLNKVKTDTVEKWTQGKGELVASYKLDGVSFMCTWENDKVVFASTRGDGSEGQDITEKIKLIVPEIPGLHRVSLRGELLLTGDDHIKLGFKNRRNGVAGIISKDDVSLDALDKLHPVFYEVLDNDGDVPRTEQERLKFIEDLNLNVVPWQTIATNEDLLNVLTLMITEAKNQNYDTDGIVLTEDETEREDVMYPTNKVAFKVNTEAVRAKVAKVEWNLGRTGRVTPLVYIEPMELDGVTVSKATGFNAEFIATSGIGAGSVVGVVRSGGVIPYLTEVFDKVEPTLPENCPSCDNRLKWKGVDLVCDNKDCYDTKVRQIAHFFKTMGSEYISETTVRNLGVSSIEEMYDLDELEIAGIEGFGIKKAEQIYYEIQKTLNNTPENLLTSFGIPGVGKTLAEPILRKYKFDELFTIDEVQYIPGVGTILSDNLVNNIGKYVNLYNFLLNKGLKFKEKDMTSSVAGKMFALTGKMPMKRDDIIRLIVSKGGSVKGMSKSTDYLVTDDPYSGSVKNTKAQSYGTKIIDFDSLMEMVR